MPYVALAAYDLDGNFVGYIPHAEGTLKIDGSNLYAEDETDKLRNRLEELNSGATIKAHWPDARDPEVVAMLEDPNFLPIETTRERIVDDENSIYFWYQPDGTSGPEPPDVNNPQVDEEASIIVWKEADVPKRPSDVIARVRKASEIVARKRAGLA
jgi:hypothetical protein